MTQPIAEPSAVSSELVQRVLARTMEAVAALDLVVSPPDGRASTNNEELIHDYRVALRRLRSIVRLLRPAFGKRKMEKFAGALREAAALTSDLRDEEVLRETLTELRPDAGTKVALEAWMTGRARRERGQRTRVSRTIRADTSLRLTLEAVRLRLEEPPKDPVPDEELARAGLSNAYDKVRARSGARSQDSPAMHSLRIAFKQLRYTLETIRGLIPPGGWEERAGAIAAKLQKHLGKLHDVDEALIRMERARGLEVPSRRAVLIELEKERRKVGARCDREVAAAMTELATLLGPPLAAQDPK